MFCHILILIKIKIKLKQKNPILNRIICLLLAVKFNVFICSYYINLKNCFSYVVCYALETVRLFVKLYPWYYMPTSIHKLSIHGSEIIVSALLPIEQLSDEAQESSNKLIKKVLRLMPFSDPSISNL